MYLQTRGIVIKTRDFSENDLMIDIFTLKAGKVSVIAKGAKKANTKLSTVSNLFVYADFELYIGKKWNRVNSVEIIRGFYEIREDLNSLAYGSYFLELIYISIMENRPDKELFILLLKALDGLKLKKYNLLKVVFEFKYMEILGYLPIMDKCVKCNKELNGDISFSVVYGGALCKNCKDKKSLNISRKLLNILIYFQHTEFYSIMDVSIHEVFIKKIDIIMFKYITYHLDRSYFKSLKFLNSLREV